MHDFTLHKLYIYPLSLNLPITENFLHFKFSKNIILFYLRRGFLMEIKKCHHKDIAIS